MVTKIRKNPQNQHRNVVLTIFKPVVFQKTDNPERYFVKIQS